MKWQRTLEGIVKEILNADDMVLLKDDWKEVKSCYSQWQKVLQEKGMKVIMKKIKAFHRGGKSIVTHPCKYLCSVCGKGVGRNLICISCWVHKRCSGIHDNIAYARNFKCKQCQGFIDKTWKKG